MNKLKNGFTLVEILIALAVSALVMTAVYAMINISQRASANVGRRVLTQQDARAVLNFMAMEVGMASFNPTTSAATWSAGALKSDGSVCIAFNNTVRKGIQIATANSILVAMDLNTDRRIGGNVTNPTNEYITYSYNATNSTITRDVSCGGAQAILGGTGSSTMVSNNAAGTPLFQYFNNTGGDISANVIASPDDPNIGISAIRRIRINIIADVENESKQGLMKISRKTFTTDVLVRNHGF
jgi:prepilin-type N-terminal cleavage/methylation domain-containing protein